MYKAATESRLELWFASSQDLGNVEDWRAGRVKCSPRALHLSLVEVEKDNLRDMRVTDGRIKGFIFFTRVLGAKLGKKGPRRIEALYFPID